MFVLNKWQIRNKINYIEGSSNFPQNGPNVSGSAKAGRVCWAYFGNGQSEFAAGTASGNGSIGILILGCIYYYYSL